ncbi:MAG: glycine zipper 2TM domain-containing protein [Sulfuricurvum sp.]|uniref:glycine zipper 2TM domain-containing protein n=1 Tax=Sulfuricurvum sp. TaxID=2025608 RepID=UPI00261A2ADA|nr:glycine zipper 2TM domain-containing protein [Sulfuricurvum sp.]MDD2829731.1 glycine zipper 2TM domain-containing protein [Sulfuricurvum sp.]MDD4949201.1 glycine zipper 2TM domain-containing protein [Sulfuricurvum sp.]
MKKLLIAMALTASASLFAQDSVGGIFGGVIGGIIGNQFGHGDGKVAATIIGASMGTLIGSNNERYISNGEYTNTNRVVYTTVQPAPIIYTQQRIVYANPRPVIYYSSYDRDDHRYEERRREHHDHWDRDRREHDEHERWDRR